MNENLYIGNGTPALAPGHRLAPGVTHVSRTRLSSLKLPYG